MGSSDEVIAKAAELLLQGSIMLNIACPVCREPIYQLKDKSMYCVKCDKPVVRQVENEKKVDQTLSTQIDPIAQKIAQLSRQLERETDQEKIVQLADTIRKLQQLK
ncbi:MAG: Sjogren's syndrome/scleroderma autoantigen 1 family protein [Candidatus Kariarchaeaceae archaeon]|jgi:UPF0148 protein